MANSDPKQGGFTVTDRRTFAEGESKPPAPAQTTAAKPDEVQVDGKLADHGHDATALPAVDFHTFVLSLGSSALLHLGELEPPDGGEPEKDLSLAKHTIDILTMLEAKTRGNLTAAEEKLMESLLYDLRLRYVNATK